MPTQAEEQQAKEFLKRAEIRTMKKDLSKLREADALTERDKIAHTKPIEEQQAEQVAVRAAQAEKVARQEVLEKGAEQEKIAEKDLKKYATEEERQRIFLLESERLGLEKQVDGIDKEKDPVLKLEKNKFLIQERSQQRILESIIDQEKKIETDQKFILEKEGTTTIPQEKKSLEQRRGELEKEVQEVEKRRWAAEKELEQTRGKIQEIDKSLQQLVEDKNILKNKISQTQKTLREIFTVVMAREEEKIRVQTQERAAQQEVLSKSRSDQREKVQREQWSNIVPQKPLKMKEGQNLKRKFDSVNLSEKNVPEDERRNQFLKNVDSWAEDKNSQAPLDQKNSVQVPVPLPPRKK